MEKNLDAARRIFLSYCQHDVVFALRLATDLKNHGINIYMDRLDTAASDDWSLHTRRAFADCTICIPVFSPAYIAADYCKQELRLAGRHGRSIFSLLLHSLAEAGWPFHPENRHFIDFRDWSDEAAYQDALADLLTVLREQAPGCMGHRPTAEQRYLNNLIAFLHAQDVNANILGEDATLPGQVPSRPQPRQYAAQLKRPFVVTDGAVGADLLFAGNEEQLPGLEAVLVDVPRFILTGLPGSGKTTLLRQVALENAWLRLIATQAPAQAVPLPIYLRAVDCAAGVDLIECLRELWPFDDDPVSLLATGHAILYLDGLQETAWAADQTAQLQAWLGGSQAPQRLIITGSAGLAEDLGLPRVEQAAPTRQQVWTDRVASLGEQAAAKLQGRLLWDNCQLQRDPPGLQRLLLHPFLLDFLRQVAGDSVTASLGALLTRLVHALCEQQVYADRPLKDLLDGLAALAYAMVADDMPVFVPVEVAVQHLADKRLLEPHNSGAFLQVANGQVRFTHYVLQVYFAARVLAVAGDETHLRPPVFTPAEERIPQRWDAAFIILAGLQADATAYVRAIGAVDSYLALHCAYSGVALSEDFLARLVSQLLQSAYVTAGAGRVAAGRLIPASSHQKGVPFIQETTRRGDWAARQAATRLLAALETPLVPGVRAALENATDAPDESLSYIRQLGTAALPTLLQLAQDSGTPAVGCLGGGPTGRSSSGPTPGGTAGR
ncbi:TIR domain-containing protein [Chloroflexota bacterium]